MSNQLPGTPLNTLLKECDLTNPIELLKQDLGISNITTKPRRFTLAVPIPTHKLDPGRATDPRELARLQAYYTQIVKNLAIEALSGAQPMLSAPYVTYTINWRQRFTGRTDPDLAHALKNALEGLKLAGVISRRSPTRFRRINHNSSRSKGVDKAKVGLAAIGTMVEILLEEEGVE